MRYLFTVLLLGLGLNTFAYQEQGEIIHIPPREAIEGNSLSFEAIYTGDLDQIQSVKILYRLAGQIGFLEENMTIRELKLSGELAGAVIGAPGIEYVIVANLKNGGLVAFPPSDDPLSNPQYVPVEEPVATQNIQNNSENFGEMVILTPEPGQIFPFGESMIAAVSLFTFENVDINSVRVFFDNVNVTAYSLVTTDLITYKPDALSPGQHTIFIEVSNIYGVRLASTSWNFIVRSQAQQIFEMDVTGSLNLNFRQDLVNFSDTSVVSVIAGDTVSIPIYTAETQSVFRSDFATNINFDWAKVKLFANLTSKEDSTLQPQNRYGVKVRTSWLKYSYGDETAMMNRLSLWGKRVRGHNIDMRFKWLNLHVVSGKTARAISGSAFFDSSSSTWNRTGYSFERGLFAIRPSFGTGKFAQVGFFYVHVRDSVNSVKTRPSLWTGDHFSEELFGSTGSVEIPFGADQYILDDSLHTVRYGLSGSNPEDNVVVGSDIKLAFDDHRFVMEGSAAFSLYNNNILEGPLTRSRLDTFSLLADTTFDDTLGTGTIDMPLANLDDLISGAGLNFLLSDGKFDAEKLADFFVLNENLTLPVDIASLDEKNYLAAMTTLALRFALKLNYYNHFINIDYHHVGPGYKALGSPVLRLDGKGWNGWKITDKMRMLDNMLYLNLGWESNKNNTTSLDPLTDPRLIQNTFSAGITLNPGQGLPTITTNMKYFTRDNNVDEIKTIVQALDATTDTTIIIDERELNELLSTNVSLTYLFRTGEVGNTLSFNLMKSDMNNLVIGYEGLLRASNLYGFNIRSEWGFPLTTTFSFNSNKNQIYDEKNPNFQSNSFSTFRMSAGYRLFASSLIIRGSIQQIIFDDQKYTSYENYESDILTKSTKTQTNMQLNTQYTFNALTIGETIVKSRVIGSYERRQYASEYTDYSDNMISARFETTF
ncbi:MAG: hypothetical protein K9N35_09050 [Candidatus Marinimicrobia bacterium]|nr:hypothetical protein [Candidatus Neomarinimicrobiota bacterium]